MASMTKRNRTYIFGDDEEGDEWEVGQQARKNKKSKAASKESEVSDLSTSSSTSVREQKEHSAKSRRLAERRAPEPGEVLTALRDADLLPCLYFLPGRKAVEEAAESAALHIFTSPEEEALIKEEVGVWLENMPKEDRSLQQVYALAEILPRGLAFHHAGLLPGLKVLVETLFARGHLRAVLLPTHLALGINMPARAVVVGSLSKFDGQEMRLLTPNEYRQLTGRVVGEVWTYVELRSFRIHPGSHLKTHSAASQVNCCLLPVPSSFAIIRFSICGVQAMSSTCDVFALRACASTSAMYCGNNAQMICLEKLEKTGSKEQESREKRKASPQKALPRPWNSDAREFGRIHSAGLAQRNSKAQFLPCVRLDT